MRSALLLWGALAICAIAHSQSYVIDTIAGGAPPLATISSPLDAPLGFLGGIASDHAGNVYFSAYNAIFKLDSGGTLTRVAGTGRPGYSGDGGPAISAQLRGPGAMTMDSAGNLFFIDNGRIRRIAPNGIITTVAGDGSFCNSAPSQCIPPDGVPAVSAFLGGASGLAVDSAGNLFIATGYIGVIRKIGSDGIVSTVAGKAGFCCSTSGDGGPAISATLSSPQAVAVDRTGNIYIAEGNRVRKVTPDGIINTFAGGNAPCPSCLGDDGPATKATLNPSSLAVDSAGNLYLTDSTNQRVRRISPGGIITTVAGNGFFGNPNGSGFSGDGGSATAAQLGYMRGLTIDGAGNLIIADSGNNRIRKVTLDGIINTVAGTGKYGCCFSGDGSRATSAELNQPWDVALDGSGNVYISDTGNNRVRKVAPDGTISTVAGNGTPVCVYPPPGQSCPPFNGDGVPATGTPVDAWGVAIDNSGNLFIGGGWDNRVRKVSPDGIISTVAGNGICCHSGDGGPAANAQLSGALRVLTDPTGDLFIAEVARIREVLPNGNIGSVAGTGKGGYSGDGGPATQAELNIFYQDDCGPYGGGLALDSAGDLFIADSDDARVREVTANDGVINTVAGIGSCNSLPGGCINIPTGDGGPATSTFVGPTSVAIDRAGNLFIADGSSRIRKVSPDGIITTIAGNGSYAYSGDGGPATGAALEGPQGIALDGAGNIYVVDTYNNAVRILRPAKTSVLISSVIDAASQRVGPISPGKIVVIYGAGLGPAKLTTGSNTGTAVSFNGSLAQILYASSTQVAAIVPDSITGTTAEVAVNYQGALSDAVFTPVAPASPGLFTLNQTGAGQAAAVNQDGTTNTAVKPAKRGGVISLYATGWSDSKLPVSVTIDGIQAPVQFAGQAPGQPSGLMQVNVQIPSGVKPGGYVPLVLKVGDASTIDGAVWIAVAGN